MNTLGRIVGIIIFIPVATVMLLLEMPFRLWAVVKGVWSASGASAPSSTAANENATTPIHAAIDKPKLLH